MPGADRCGNCCECSDLFNPFYIGPYPERSCGPFPFGEFAGCQHIPTSVNDTGLGGKKNANADCPSGGSRSPSPAAGGGAGGCGGCGKPC